MFKNAFTSAFWRTSLIYRLDLSRNGAVRLIGGFLSVLVGLVTGEGLEPSTNGLTYLIGFHDRPDHLETCWADSSRKPCLKGRIPWFRVGSLDYPFAIAGVPRLVSGAGAGSSPVPCLLITQSDGFSDHHACRYRRRCGANGSQGVPAYCGIHSSQFGFFPREAPISLPPDSVRSPLLYRLSYPVSRQLPAYVLDNPCRPRLRFHRGDADDGVGCPGLRRSCSGAVAGAATIPEIAVSK